MKATLSVAIAIALAASVYAAPAVVLVVRHAEKEAVPKEDPPLTVEGKRRASELSAVVQAWMAAGAPVRGLFSSDTARARQTLAPLADYTGVRVTEVKGKATAELVQRILAVDGGIVVVAGHSNTVPDIVQALGGPAGIVIADGEFDRLFAVTQPGARARVAALRYGALTTP